MSEEVDFFAASDHNDDDHFFDSSEVIIDNIQKVYMSEDLSKSSDFFLPEEKESICLKENRSSDELKLESTQLGIDIPIDGIILPTNVAVSILNTVEENFAQENNSNIEINFDYDIAFRSHSYDEAKSCPQGLDETIQPVVNPFLSYGKRVITSPVINPFSSRSADKESDQSGIRLSGSNSYDGSHFDYDATFPSSGESKNSTTCLDDIIPPVVNPFIAYGKREITTPVVNPFSPANETSISPSIAKVFYTVNEYSKIVVHDTNSAMACTRDSTPPQDVFSVCPPDSPDSPINASPGNSVVEGDGIPAEDIFISHYYGSEKSNHSTIGDSAWVEEFAVDTNDLDFDNIINNVSANLGNNFNRSSFSTFNSPSLIPEPVPVASNHFNESVAVESESSNIDNSTRAQKIVPQSASRPDTVTSRSASKIPVAKTPQGAPKVVAQGLSAKKLNSLLTEMQVRLKVAPSEELTNMVSNFAAVAADPKMAVVCTTNRLSSKNINLHNEIISHEELSSSPISPSTNVEPTTELREIKRGGKITKPSGYTSPSSRRDSDTFSVSSNRSVKTRSSIGTVVSKQSTLSHSSKAGTTVSRLSTKSANAATPQLNKRFESSASSVRATVKSNSVAAVKKATSPGSGYGHPSSTAIPVLSRNRAAVSPVSFTSPAAPAPRSRPQSFGGTTSKAISPITSSTTPRSTTAFSAEKKTPPSDISIKRSKSSDGLLRSSNIKEAALGTAKSPVATSSPRSADGKSDLKASRSQTVTPTSTLQRSKSLDKTQTVRKNISSDSTSTYNPASVSKAVTPTRTPYTGTLYDTKSSKKATPVAEVVSVGAAAKSSPSLKSPSFDSLRSAKKNMSSMTSRILAADDLQRARSCELSPSPIKGTRAVKEEKAAAYAFPTSTPPQEEPMTVITAEEFFLPPHEKKRAIEAPVPAAINYEVVSANPMLSAKVPTKIVTRERSDSRDSMASSASNQNSFLSIYSPASGSNILQVKRTKTPPVIRSVTTTNRDTSVDHTAIGEEYHLRAMNEAASTSTSSTSRSSARRSSSSLSKSASPSEVFLSMPPPPRPRPDAAVLVSPLPKKSLADTSQYMPSLTQASHEMITMMFQNIDASSKGGKIDVGIENESSQTNVLVKTPLAMDAEPNQENVLLSML